MVGVAVKVTSVPEQMGFAVVTMATLAGTLVLTVIATGLEVAGDPVKHGVAFEVISTVITSPLANVVEV